LIRKGLIRTGSIERIKPGEKKPINGVTIVIESIKKEIESLRMDK